MIADGYGGEISKALSLHSYERCSPTLGCLLLS
jgi:hypothetical protein